MVQPTFEDVAEELKVRLLEKGDGGTEMMMSYRSAKPPALGVREEIEAVVDVHGDAEVVEKGGHVGDVVRETRTTASSMSTRMTRVMEACIAASDDEDVLRVRVRFEGDVYVRSISSCQYLCRLRVSC